MAEGGAFDGVEPWRQIRVRHAEQAARLQGDPAQDSAVEVERGADRERGQDACGAGADGQESGPDAQGAWSLIISMLNQQFMPLFPNTRNLCLDFDDPVPLGKDPVPLGKLHHNHQLSHDGQVPTS